MISVLGEEKLFVVLPAAPASEPGTMFWDLEFLSEVGIDSLLRWEL
jgi:hypothetical protein